MKDRFVMIDGYPQAQARRDGSLIRIEKRTGYRLVAAREMDFGLSLIWEKDADSNAGVKR